VQWYFVQLQFKTQLFCKIEEYHLPSAEQCTFLQMSTKHQCNQLTKKNSRSCRSVEILFRCTERRNILEKNSGARNSRAVRSQNDNCYSLFGPPKKQGQNLFDLKQDRGVAKRTNCVRNQAVEQQYNDTRGWRCYEAALLLKKKRDISLTRKHP